MKFIDRVLSKRSKERIKEAKFVFKKNWNLFRESRIGLIGLGIMIAFLLLAALTPFMGLKDPVRWIAPSRDVLEIKQVWNVPLTGGESIVCSSILQLDEKTLDTRVQRLYLTTTGSDSHLFCLDIPTARTTGKYSWKFPGILDKKIGTIYSQPVLNHKGTLSLTDDAVYFTSVDKNVYAVNASTGPQAGKKLWNYTTDSPIYSSVTLDQQATDTGQRFNPNQWVDRASYHRVFVGTGNGTLYCVYWKFNCSKNIECVDKNLTWSIHLANASLYTPVVAGDRIYCTSTDGWLYSVSINATSAGKLVWKEHVDSDGLTSQPVYNENTRRIYIGSNKGKLHFVTLDASRNMSKLPNETYPLQLRFGAWDDKGKVSVPAVRGDGSEIFVGTSHYPDRTTPGCFYALRKTGSFKWNNTTAGDITTQAAIGEQIFVSANDPEYGGRLYSFSDKGEMKWRIDIAASEPGKATNVSAPFVASNFEQDDPLGTKTKTLEFARLLYIGSGDGAIYAYVTTGKYLAPLSPGQYPSGNWYILGTDDMGRDILSQLLWGSRIALLVGFCAAFFSVLIGTIVGLVAGYFGKTIDSVLMRFTDVILVLPGLPLLIIFAAVMGPSIWNLIIIISIVGWSGTARVIRAEVLSLKERPFIDSARVTGAGHARIMFKHIAPNVLPLAFLFMTFAVTGAIISEASLSFIGLGDPTSMSWGIMLFARSHSGATLTAWWWLIPPGLAITLVCLGFFLMGHAFETIVNPRLRRR